jgi:hypothetical protein
MTEVATQVQETFAPHGPRREWLLRCHQPEHDDRIAICSVLAEDGRIVVVATDDNPAFVLEGEQIGAFREAFLAATAVAAADLRAPRVPTTAT